MIAAGPGVTYELNQNGNEVDVHINIDPQAMLEWLVLSRCGYVDGAEVTAHGSADNDLAHERAQVALKLIDYVAESGWPEGILERALDEKERRS